LIFLALSQPFYSIEYFNPLFSFTAQFFNHSPRNLMTGVRNLLHFMAESTDIADNTMYDSKVLQSFSFALQGKGFIVHHFTFTFPIGKNIW
jgi:hypothetical protein